MNRVQSDGNSNQVFIYLLLAYILSWGIWIGCYVLNLVQTAAFQILNIAIMWVPALSVWITKRVTKDDGFIEYSMIPNFKGNRRWFFLAWSIPIIVTLLGGILYFLIFPNDFDITLSYIEHLINSSGSPQPDISLPMLTVAQIIAAVTYAPIINTFVALGEEIGWRGFLFPELSRKYSRPKAHIIVGIIWGLWHTPINMMGHNYGLEYSGYPWLGIIAMSIFCFAAGVILSWLTEKSGTIWTAALGHGAINAVAGIPMLFNVVGKGNRQIFGPALSGLIAGIPILILAIIILFKGEQDRV